MVYFVQVLPKIMIVLFEIIIFCNNNKSFPLALDVILTFPQYRSKFNSLLEGRGKKVQMTIETEIKLRDRERHRITNVTKK
jgi:hypothetical protein